MMRFWIVGAIAVAALALSPLLLLRGDRDLPRQYEGLVVHYDSYSAEIKSLDPATCGDVTSWSVQGNIFEGLYCYHYLKRPVEVIPQLAAGMPQFSPDGLTCTIRLCKGARYARNPCFGTAPDGTHGTRAVRADDFVLALKRAADYHVNSGLAWAFISGRIVGLDDYRTRTMTGFKPGDFSRYDLPVDGVQALDGLTLRLRLTRPFPQLVNVLALSLYAPIPREAVDYWLAGETDGHGGPGPIPMDQRSTEFREPCQLAGTGPYVLQEYVRKCRIVLVRNPDFRDDYYPTEGAPGDREAGMLADAGKKVPFTDVLHSDYVPEDYPAWMRFIYKQTDAGGIPRETFESVVRPDKDLVESWKREGITLRRYDPPTVYWIVLNMEDRVLGSSKALRQAMSLAVDVETYIKVLHNGRARRAMNILPGTLGKSGRGCASTYARYDLAEARRKMAQARRELQAAGVLATGQDLPVLTLDIIGRDTNSARMGEFFRQQFAQVGLKVKVVLSDWPTVQEKVNNKGSQMCALGYAGHFPDALDFLELFYSPNIARQTNQSNYSNPRFDRLYERASAMGDTPRRAELYSQMSAMVCEDCPVLLLTEPEGFVLFHEWVKNTRPHPFAYGLAKYVRVDDELRKRRGGR